MDGKIQYVECKLSPAENNLRVMAFLGANFKRDPQTILIDESTTDKDYPLRVEGCLPRRNGNISAMSRLSFASFVQTENDFGAPCFVDTGTNHLFLGDILAGIKDRGVYEKDLPLVMHTADDLVKGTVRVSISKLDMGGIEMDEPMLEAEISAEGESMMNYIQQTMAVEESVPDTLLGKTENIKAPYDISESGLEFTNGTPLPVMAYAKFEVPESNGRFWDNALEQVMKRQSLSTDAYWKMGHAGKADTLARVSVYMAQYMDYISDEVDRNMRNEHYNRALKSMFENFGDAGTTHSGDCEDTGLFIAMTYDAFMEHDMEDARNKDVLEDMQSIGRHYIPLMSLDVVHGAKVADQTEQVGAHLNTMFFPIHYFRKALEKHPEGKYLSQKVKWPDTDDYPFLTGEGTGKFDPLGGPDEIAEQRQIIYSVPSTGGFKKDLTHPIGAPSSFYLGSLMGITNYFLKQNVPIGSFVYGTVDPLHSKQGWTRGAMYTHMINERTDVVLVPHPPVPAKTLDLINEATLSRVPPRKLVLSEDSPLPVRNKELDRLAAAFNQPKGPSVPVPIYMCPHQLNARIVDRMMSDFRQVPELSHITYDLEPITDDFYGYRVLFHVLK